MSFLFLLLPSLPLPTSFPCRRCPGCVWSPCLGQEDSRCCPAFLITCSEPDCGELLLLLLWRRNVGEYMGMPERAGECSLLPSSPHSPILLAAMACGHRRTQGTKAGEGAPPPPQLCRGTGASTLVSIYCCCSPGQGHKNVNENIMPPPISLSIAL